MTKLKSIGGAVFALLGIWLVATLISIYLGAIVIKIVAIVIALLAIGLLIASKKIKKRKLAIKSLGTIALGMMAWWIWSLAKFATSIGAVLGIAALAIVLPFGLLWMLTQNFKLWVKILAAVLVILLLVSFGPLQGASWLQRIAAKQPKPSEPTPTSISNALQGTEPEIEETDIKVPINAWELYPEEYEEFKKLSDMGLDRSSLCSPANDDETDFVLKGDGKAIEDEDDVMYRYAANPTFGDMNANAWVNELTPSGETIGEQNPWMQLAIDKGNGEEGLNIWLEKNKQGKWVPSEEYRQELGFPMWILTSRFKNLGVQKGLIAAVHYPLKALEIGRLPKTYREENKPYKGEFLVLAYTQKGQEKPFALYGFNVEDGRHATLNRPTPKVQKPDPTETKPTTTKPTETAETTKPTEPTETTTTTPATTLEPKPADPKKYKTPEGKPTVPSVETDPVNTKTPEPPDAKAPPKEVPETTTTTKATTTTAETTAAKTVPVVVTEAAPPPPPPIETGLSQEPNEEPIDNPFGP